MTLEKVKEVLEAEKLKETKASIPSEISAEEWAEIDEVIARHKDRPGSLIPVLQRSQEICGYLPAEVQRRIAEGLKVSPSQVYGVVTFYSFFTTVPRGRHTIRVCLGTACYVRGSRRVLSRLQSELGIKVGGITEDRKYSLETVRCLGACGLAPVMVIGNDTYGLMDPTKAMNIVRKYD